METSYFKLNAKKRIMKNYFKCFTVSVFPFVSVVLLTILNYCLLILLNRIGFNMYFSPYASYIKFSIMLVSIFLSVFLWKSLQLLVDSYFLVKALNKKVTFIKAIKCVTFRHCITYFVVSAIRFCLSISWFTIYLSPCIVVSALLIYTYKKESYSFNINLTLLVSAILLLVIGFSFFYITLKRYAMCSSIILTEEEKNPLKIIVKSIEIMENKSLKYAFYCLSFSGWLLSCLLIIPIFYVVPYFNMSKWCFKNSLESYKFAKPENEKPIIFYFTKRVEN